MIRVPTEGHTFTSVAILEAQNSTTPSFAYGCKFCAFAVNYYINSVVSNFISTDVWQSFEEWCLRFGISHSPQVMNHHMKEYPASPRMCGWGRISLLGTVQYIEIPNNM
jgi:hypothetical protein